MYDQELLRLDSTILQEPYTPAESGKSEKQDHQLLLLLLECRKRPLKLPLC